MAKRERPEDSVLSKLQQTTRELAIASSSLDRRAANGVRTKLDEVIRELRGLYSKLDSIREPDVVFDPGNPDVVGGFIGIAMLAQQRHPLDSVEPFYGSGIYALYYNGDFPSYRPLARTEHPIYVGKADPATPSARTPREQDVRLLNRLRDHARTIKKATTTLSLGDFACRFLVVQSGWEAAAETFLIDLFKPIWNNETGICHGIGKHGDDPTTRANLRSPWDTMHPGRDWAYRDPKMHDQTSKGDIEAALAAHFSANRPFTNETEVLKHFFDRIRQ